jgi:hypothetical protein
MDLQRVGPKILTGGFRLTDLDEAQAQQRRMHAR